MFFLIIPTLLIDSFSKGYPSGRILEGRTLRVEATTQLHRRTIII